MPGETHPAVNHSVQDEKFEQKRGDRMKTKWRGNITIPGVGPPYDPTGFEEGMERWRGRRGTGPGQTQSFTEQQNQGMSLGRSGSVLRYVREKTFSKLIP